MDNSYISISQTQLKTADKEYEGASAINYKFAWGTESSSLLSVRLNYRSTKKMRWISEGWRCIFRRRHSRLNLNQSATHSSCSYPTVDKKPSSRAVNYKLQEPIHPNCALAVLMQACHKLLMTYVELCEFYSLYVHYQLLYCNVVPRL